MRFIGAQITVLSIALFYLSNICNAQNFDDKYYNSGLAYAVQGKFEEAKKDFYKSLEVDDDHQPAEKALRIIMDASKNKITAEIAVYIFEGTDYRAKGELDKALTKLNAAVMLSPAYSPSYNERGFVYYRMGKYKLAVNDFEKAIKIEPDYIDAYYNRGITYYLDHDYKKAWEDIEKAKGLGKKLSPEFVRVFKEAAEK